jgi:hypothetical protein
VTKTGPKCTDFTTMYVYRRCPRSLCPLITLSPGHFVPSHFVPWSLCPPVILSSVILSPVTLSPSHFVHRGLCPWSLYPPVTLSPVTLSPSHFDSWSLCLPVTLSPGPWRKMRKIETDAFIKSMAVKPRRRRSRGCRQNLALHFLFSQTCQWLTPS